MPNIDELQEKQRKEKEKKKKRKKAYSGAQMTDKERERAKDEQADIPSNTLGNH